VTSGRGRTGPRSGRSHGGTTVTSNFRIEPEEGARPEAVSPKLARAGSMRATFIVRAPVLRGRSLGTRNRA